jgi:hypothetical protein
MNIKRCMDQRCPENGTGIAGIIYSDGHFGRQKIIDDLMYSINQSCISGRLKYVEIENPIPSKP